MSSPDATEIRGMLHRQLGWLRSLNDPVRHPANRSPWLAPLRAWQAERLAGSFRDFLADPRMRPAAEFFLSDLYGDRDFSARDQQIGKVVPIMARIMPARLLLALGDAIALAALSHAFDLRMCRVLEAGWGPRPALDLPTYAEAYRRCGLPRLRGRQIDLIVELGWTLDDAVHRIGVERLLKLSRLPARAAGLSDLQQFLERGFAAFRKLDGADEFLARIESGERAVSARLFAGDPAPFRPS